MGTVTVRTACYIDVSQHIRQKGDTSSCINNAITSTPHCYRNSVTGNKVFVLVQYSSQFIVNRQGNRFKTIAIVIAINNKSWDNKPKTPPTLSVQHTKLMVMITFLIKVYCINLRLLCINKYHIVCINIRECIKILCTVSRLSHIG